MLAYVPDAFLCMANRNTKAARDLTAHAVRLVQLFAGDADSIDQEIKIGEGDTPPTELRLFPMGEFETSKGTFSYDAKSGEEIMTARAKRAKIDLVSDYEHQSLANPPVKAPASGWYQIEARADGLYAVNIRWTPVALEHFKNKEYRYFSQAFDVDSNGRVCAFKNFGLTNMPANYEIPALVAASDNGSPAHVSGADLASASSDELADLLKTLDPELFDLASQITPETNPVSWVADEALWGRAKEAASKYKGESYFYPLVTYIYKNMGGTITRAKKTTAPAVTTTETSHMEEIKKALADLIAKLGESGMGEDEAMKLVEAALAKCGYVKATAAPAPADAALPAELVALTDRKTSVEAMGVVRAWKEANARVVELTAKVSEFEKSAASASFDAAVKEGVDAKKISPALVENWIPVLKAQGEAGIVQLRAFLGSAAPIVQGEKTEPAHDSVTLTSEERTMIRLNKLNEKDYLEHKRSKSIALVSK